MATKRVHITLDAQGNSIVGAATAPAGTSTDQVATTAFVTAATSGNGKTVDLVNRQTNAVTVLVATDTVVQASDYVWRSALLPVGCNAYLEVNGFGSVLGLGATASLYTAAGVLVTGSTVTVTSLTADLAESGAFTPPANGTRIHVRVRTSGVVGTASFLVVRINIR